MKTFNILALAITASFSLNANANSLYNDPGIGDVFPMKSISIQENKITSIKDTGEQIWSVEYEQWVNPTSFNSNGKHTIAGVLSELKNNPPAAGGTRQNVIFNWDQTAGEYQLQ